MPNEAKTKIQVEKIVFERDRDKLVAVAEVSVGDMRVRGLRIWKSAKGKLRVFLPSHRLGESWEDVVALPEELRAAAESEVLSTYHATQPVADIPTKNDKRGQNNAK